MRRLLGQLGPPLAAVQIYALLSVFQTFGPLAHWFVEYWIPATRRFWTSAIGAVSAQPATLSGPEMDSLTAVAFFVPLSISSLLHALHSRPSESKDTEEIEIHAAVLKSALLRSAAVLAAIASLFLISRQLLFDITLLLLSNDRDTRDPTIVSLIAFAVLAIYAVIVFAIYFFRAGIDFWGRIIGFVTTGVGIIELLLLGAPILVGAYLATQEIGVLRTFSVLVVLLAITLTIAVRPTRILMIGIFLMIFVGCGIVWDLLPSTYASELTGPG